MPNPWFDPAFYRRTAMPDASPEENPLVHFLQSDLASLSNPCHQFHSQWYLETYPEVAEAGLNPLLHYLEAGAAENRSAAGFAYNSGCPPCARAT